MIANTKEQRDILREGGAKLGFILKALVDYAQQGAGVVSTQDIEDKARVLIAESGGTSATLNYTPSGARRPFPAATCVSINDELVHGIPNENPQILQEGDIVSIDCLLEYKGLITDSCITIGVGKMSKTDKLLIKAAKEARTIAIQTAKIGATTGDIGHAVFKVAQKYGFDVARELGGHGVGEQVHEDPFIPSYGQRGKGERLVKNMVLAIEPILMAGRDGIILKSDGYTYASRDGQKSAQFEHTVIITEQGAEILTK